MTQIPGSHKDLLERPILFHLATIQPDGQPQVTPVWGDLHEGNLRINTAAGRQKYKNLQERPRATVLVVDPDNVQRYIEVRGKVRSISEADGDAVIDKLAKDYLGADEYPYRNPAETRVTVLIEPTHVVTG